MKKLKRLFVVLSILGNITLLNASLPIPASDQSSYAQVESEPLPFDLHLKTARMFDGEKETQPKGRVGYSAPPTSHTGAYHTIFNFFTFGDENIQLNDGSVWTVNPVQLKLLESWSREDEVVIVPNTTWFFKSDYKYKIWRYRHNDYIEVNLRWGSYMYSNEFKYITYVDTDKLEVYLNDYSVWKIHSKNSDLLRAWREHQVVIIGTNNGWFSRMKNILINVNNNSYVISNCVH